MNRNGSCFFPQCRVEYSMSAEDAILCFIIWHCPISHVCQWFSGYGRRSPSFVQLHCFLLCTMHPDWHPLPLSSSLSSLSLSNYVSTLIKSHLVKLVCLSWRVTCRCSVLRGFLRFTTALSLLQQCKSVWCLDYVCLNKSINQAIKLCSVCFTQWTVHRRCPAMEGIFISISQTQLVSLMSLLITLAIIWFAGKCWVLALMCLTFSNNHNN